MKSTPRNGLDPLAHPAGRVDHGGFGPSCNMRCTVSNHRRYNRGKDARATGYTACSRNRGRQKQYLLKRPRLLLALPRPCGQQAAS